MEEEAAEMTSVSDTRRDEEEIRSLAAEWSFLRDGRLRALIPLKQPKEDFHAIR